MPVDHNRHLSVSWSDPALLQGVEKEAALDRHICGAWSRAKCRCRRHSNCRDFKPISVEPGEMVFALDPAEQHYNLIACVHGGIS